jgi:Ca2+-transporting ATPase
MVPMRSLSELQASLGTFSEEGLSAEAVTKSRAQFGANRLTPLPREPLWKKFLDKFDEPIIKILLAAALLSMFVELFQKGALVFASVALVMVIGGVVYALGNGLGQWIPSLLFASAVLLFIIGAIFGHALVEGLAVMIAVFLATGVAFLSEYRSDREFDILNRQKNSIQVKVVRGKQFHTVPLEQIVVGDRVKLEVGDEVPADGRVVTATELMIDQSLMTGESESVKKRPQPDATSDGPHEASCVYRGTQVVDGVGEMIVTEVGDSTYLGQIARRLSTEIEEEGPAEGGPAPVARGGTRIEKGSEEERIRQKLTISKTQTPLQKKLSDLADLISKVGYIAAGLIFAAMLVRGILVGEVGAEAGPLGSLKSLLNYFVYMVIIIVVAVPEGLPMSVTVSLALAMRKMTRANSLVRQLVACETIGSATVICSDKTGTLTQNKMTVERLYLDGKLYEPDKPDWPRPPSGLSVAHTPLEWVVLNSAVNSTAHLEQKEGKTIIVGSSTEGALLHYLTEGHLDYEQLRTKVFPEIYQNVFKSETKRMTTVIRHSGALVSLVKGAPEVLLERCTQVLGADGTLKPLTKEIRAAIVAALGDLASRAMRTLGFAHATLPADTPTTEEQLHDRRDTLDQNLIFDGFVAIRDPIRDDVGEAVQKCREAGIEVKMITGDNVVTARAIAVDIGLIEGREAPIDTPSAKILTSEYFGQQFELLKTLRSKAETTPDEKQRIEELRVQLTGLRVLARARPLDKYKMVELLQGQEEVVAMTGDGTNDAPALKRADVGLAMGIAGTEVAKEASKIVLLDDSFSTIVKAVHWGRALYENIQRFIQFQLTINVSALTIAFLGPFLGVKPPFTVLQLLWINVIMDTFASIALCSEPPREGLLKQKPKRKDENIVTPQMTINILATAGFFVVVMLALLFLMKGTPEAPGWWAGPGLWLVEDGPDTKTVPGNEIKKDAAGHLSLPTATGEHPVSVSFTRHQASLFFTIYIFFQVWNQINCRSLVPEVSGLVGLHRNPTFLIIVGLIVLMQVVIVMWEPLASIFQVEPLDGLSWAVIVVGTASVLGFAEIARRVQLALRKQSGAPAQKPAV